MNKPNLEGCDNVLQSNCNDFLSVEDDDPISAYFKQRNSKSRSSLLNSIASDHDSSLGVFDMDSLAVFDDIESIELNNIKLPHSLKKSNERSSTISSKGDILEIAKGKTTELPSENEAFMIEKNLNKQRELAKKALMDFNLKLEAIEKNMPCSKSPTEVEKTTCTNSNLIKQIHKRVDKKNWLERNYTPETPKVFRDELNSLSETCDTPFQLKTCNKKIQLDISLSSKTSENLVEKDIECIRQSDLVFETQDKDAILNRFEEDERQFLKEQSALSNDSEISQFSGVMGQGNDDPWYPKQNQELSDNERISIGKYFGMRSTSITSLIGGKAGKGSPPINFEIQDNNVGDPAFSGLSIRFSEIDLQGKPNLQVESPLKRSQSSRELQRRSETKSCGKNSDVSCDSTSTSFIENLISDMDSKLSGTQINDKLIDLVTKRKDRKGEQSSENSLVENMETPKSSKNTGRSRMSEKYGKEKFEFPERDTGGTVLDRKKSKSSVEMSSAEFKENYPVSGKNSSPRLDKKVLSLKNEFITRNKQMSFEASTPKYRGAGSHQAEKFQSDCGKLLINEKDWEPLRLSSIRLPLNLTDSLSGEETDKTLMSDRNKSRTLTNKEKVSLEDTIAEGDLTLLSKKIAEMKEDDVCIVPPATHKEKDILTVVQKLVKFPKGSVDCSALTPLLRDQYPELLSRLSAEMDDSMNKNQIEKLKANDSVVVLPGSWVKLTTQYGFKEKIFAPVKGKKLIRVPVENVKNDWLVVTLEAVSVKQQSKWISGRKVKGEFAIEDICVISLKDTLIAPQDIATCKINFLINLPVKIHVKLKLCVRRLSDKQSRTEELLIQVLGVLPEEHLTLTPKNEINFGVLPRDCHEDKLVQITFEGKYDLPVKIFIEETQYYHLRRSVTLNGVTVKDCTWRQNVFFYKFKEGAKSILQFNVRLLAKSDSADEEDIRIDVKSIFTVALDDEEDRILRQLSLSATIGTAKFLCCSTSTPIIFRTYETDQPIFREFPIRNTGSIDLLFSLSVLTEDGEQQSDDLFTVPKNYFLPVGALGTVEIKFNANTKNNYTKRLLVFEFARNSKVSYEVELIGILMPDKRPLSRYSSNSGPLNSVQSTENVSFKLKTTSQSISWPSVALDVEQKQTFQIMNTSSCNAIARFSFRKPTSSFRFLNDNGETMEKLKKVLKPNCSNVMTVIFKPESIGPHTNAILIETNYVSGMKMITLNGYGGAPKLFTRNLKSDLNGSKMVQLVNSESDNHIFRSTVQFVNKGNVSCFISIKTIMQVFSLSSELHIDPSNFVVNPNSKVDVRFNQKLKYDDVKRVLKGRDIGKLATITVTAGDEPSRYRLKKLNKEKKITLTGPVAEFLKEFRGEKSIDVDKFQDDKTFESALLRSLESTEIAAVVERLTDTSETTMLEDFEETVIEFETILPAGDISILSDRGSRKYVTTPQRNLRLDKANLSQLPGDSSKLTGRNVTDWLERVERP